MSVCWWMPSPIITPQSRKHMKRIFGHSFHSVTTFLKRQRAAGQCGGRSLCYCFFQAINWRGNQRKTPLIRPLRRFSQINLVNGHLKQHGEVYHVSKSIHSVAISYSGQCNMLNVPLIIIIIIIRAISSFSCLRS